MSHLTASERAHSASAAAAAAKDLEATLVRAAGLLKQGAPLDDYTVSMMTLSMRRLANLIPMVDDAAVIEGFSPA